MDDRYQFQSWNVKAYRWLRYMPLYTFYAVVQIIWWAVTGMRKPFDDWPFSRRQTLDCIWTSYRSMACMKMRYYITGEEFLGELRQKAGDGMVQGDE